MNKTTLISELKENGFTEIETDKERQLYIKKKLEQAEEELKKAEGK